MRELDRRDLPAWEDLAERAARAAGALVRQRRDAVDVMEVTATKSTKTDIVTASDVAAEQLLRRFLLAERPDDGMVGEEGDDHPGTTGLTWILDPIDGTVNYLYGLPGYAVSVAVADADGQSLAGCVHAPVSGETWTAHRGGGARLNGRPLRVNVVAALDAALVGTGFGYAASRRAVQAQVLTEVLPRIRDVRRAGAASLDLCAVATGRLDAYYERGLKPWDLAAGGLIATEAGAVVSGLAGASASEEMVLAAASPLHGYLDELLQLLDPLRD